VGEGPLNCDLGSLDTPKHGDGERVAPGKRGSTKPWGGALVLQEPDMLTREFYSSHLCLTDCAFLCTAAITQLS